MEEQYNQSIIQSLIKVLGTMAQTQIRAGNPRIKDDEKAAGVVSGLISFEGDLLASIALSFSEEAILEIAHRMLMVPFPQIDDMVEDLAGELANMLIGGVKGQLENQGYRLSLSLPTVVSGANHDICHKFDLNNKVIIPFSSDAGDIFVEYCIGKAA